MNLKERCESAQYDSPLGSHLYNYAKFCSWCRWYPDLFLDMIRPETGSINLHFDQRVYLRSILRFASLYGVFPRGWSKTYLEFLAFMEVAIFYPGITLAITAQTKENAASLIKEKYTEVIKHYPLLKDEVEYARFSKNDAEIVFKNGSRIDNLANAQTSKGQRRVRIAIEEAALLNDALYQDALKPIVEVPRYTIGKLAIADPCELNQQVNFFTTAGFRGSDEYVRSVQMVKNMIDLKGDIVLGSSWFLGCWYGRGSSKSQILKKKKEMSMTAFAQNYESKWVGCTDNALVSINKLMECRNLTETASEALRDDEYYLGVDVARSQNSNNNQSSVCVARVRRHGDNGKIMAVEIVNIINIPNILNFTTQASIIKSIQRRYKARAVVMDGNGLGAGLIDECLKETVDLSTGEIYPCWNTINDNNMPEDPDTAEQILYNLKAQSVQSRVVTNFIDTVGSRRLRLLVSKQLSDFSVAEQDDFDWCVAPFIQTDCLFEEIANLRLKPLSNGNVTIERVITKMDKDRASALLYVLWYINEFCRDSLVSSEYEFCTLIN